MAEHSVTDKDRTTRDGPLGSCALTSTVLLIERVQRGDQAALDHLCDRYVPRLRQWARGRLPRYARDLRETDDLVQEAFIGALRHIDSFEQRGEGAFHAYLCQAVYNRIRDEIRRNMRRPRSDETFSGHQASGQSPVERAIGRERMEAYQTALEKLRPHYRDAVVARLELGLNYEEIAGALGRASPDAARMLVNRAVRALAEEVANG